MRKNRFTENRILQWALVAGLAIALVFAIIAGVIVSRNNEVPNGGTSTPTTIPTTQPSLPESSEPSVPTTEGTVPSETITEPTESEGSFEIELSLNGESVIVLEFGKAFSDPGAQASAVSGKNRIPLEIHSEGQVDLTRLGTYQIVYTAEYKGQRSSAVRTVQVVDTTAPMITLVPQATPILPGQPYAEDGYTATDNYDGDITARVQRIEAEGIVRYTVTDSSGNVTEVERVLQYAQLKEPVLTLKGEQTMTIQAGTEWKEPGYTAIDGTGADLTHKVQISGQVNWYAAGAYTLKYVVSDANGKEATATRKVIVEPIRQPDVVKPDGKIVYLTFDDGPVKYTKRLLEILEKYNVKATFFVCGNSDLSILDDIVEGGHTLGLHSMSHLYEVIYSSEDAFFSDLYELQQVVYEKTGVKSMIMRFPGGSSNRVSKKYNLGIMTRLAQAVKDQGFRYFDWNVDSDDAGNTTTSQGVAQNVIDGIKKKDISVVLQHDIKNYSVDAVEEIIIWGLQNGYTFLPLEQNSPKCEHEIRN